MDRVPQKEACRPGRRTLSPTGRACRGSCRCNHYASRLRASDATTVRDVPGNSERSARKPPPPTSGARSDGPNERRWDVTPLSPIEARALRAAVKYMAITCALLGYVLWGKPGRGNCSCPWARPAGGVIKRLRARGLIQRHRVPGDPRTFYRPTWRGEKLLRTDNPTRAAAGLGAAPTREEP